MRPDQPLIVQRARPTAASQAFGLFPEPDITIQFESVTACQIAANGINELGSGKSDVTGVYVEGTNEIVAAIMHTAREKQKAAKALMTEECMLCSD